MTEHIDTLLNEVCGLAVEGQAIMVVESRNVARARIGFLRYPGGKQRLLRYLLRYMPQKNEIEGRYVEPFVGGGAVFFALNPRQAVLSDINGELIDLYRGLRRHPGEVWRRFRSFPSTKRAYYRIRDSLEGEKDLASRAARTLYLNRTCFKGMWRQNSSGRFNVGYGGQDRRWVLDELMLKEIARHLKRARLIESDFEEVIDACCEGDYVFADPPYKPAEREMSNDHYVYSRFDYGDHQRLASALGRAERRGISWALTTSSHPDIQRLYKGKRTIQLPKGTGSMPGILTDDSGEVLMFN